jgi:hypothetical protein
MPNLFSALSSTKSDSLAMQLALLENVNMSNALMPKIKDGFNKGAAVVDTVAKFFGNKRTIVGGADATDLKTKVQQSYSRHKSGPSTVLVKNIRVCCLSRTGMQAAVSDTLLSVKIIEEAAKFYEVDEWLTPAEKAESVSRRHQEESLANLRKMVAKMSPQERAELEKTITQELNGLPHEQREAILRDLRLDTLSGEAVTKALLASGGPLASMAALSAAGFGAYVALTTIIHAVATTLLGITLPFAVYTTATSALSLLAGPVGWLIAGATMLITWRHSETKLSRSLFAGLVTSAADILPSPSTFVPPSSPLDPHHTDNTAEAAESLEKKTALAESAMEASRKQLARVNEQLARAERANANAQREIESTQSRLNASSLGSDEVARLKAERKAAEELAYAELSRAEQYKREIALLTSERDRLEREAAQQRERRTSFEDGEAKRLLDFWAIHFPRIIFERQPVRWVVRKRHKERLSLERKLIELSQSDDPAALSLGKMRTPGEHHLRFKLDQVECRMYYRVKGTNIQIIEFGTNQETH